MLPVAPPLDPKNKVWAFEKQITLFDRARRVVVGTALEHLEHVHRRIRGEITRISCWNFNIKLQYFEFLGTIVWPIENLITPFDRARRVVLETRAEHLEHVLGRIRSENTWIRWQLHLHVCDHTSSYEKAYEKSSSQISDINSFTNEGTSPTVQSLLSSNSVHNVDPSQIRKTPKG
jgi:hypothetical protein